MMPVRRHRHAAHMTAGIASTAILLLSGCSQPDRPGDPPIEPVGIFRGTIPTDDVPGGLLERLNVRTLAGVAPVRADGSFEVAADTTRAEQPLVAATEDGTPLFLAFSPAASTPITLGAESTVDALLAIDPLLLGVPDSVRQSLTRQARALAGEAAGLIRSRLAAGRNRVLVDKEDLELQRLLAQALRRAGGFEGVGCPVGDGSVSNPAGLPRVESGSGNGSQPVAVNPFPTHYALTLDGYFEQGQKSTITLGPATLIDLLRVGEPARKPISLASGRYRVRFSNGVEGAHGAPDSPGWDALGADMGEVAGALLDALRIGSPAPWRTDGAILRPERMERIEGYTAALTNADPHALLRALYDVVGHNMQIFLPQSDPTLAEALCAVGAAQGEAAAEGHPGPLLCALVHPPAIEGGNIRVDGPLVTPMDPPNLVRRPADVNAAYYRGRVLLAWRDIANNEETYVIERTEGDASEEIARLGEDAHSFDDRAIRPASSYSYRVLALNRASRSDWSDPAHIDTPAEIDTIAPDPVRDLRAENAGEGMVLLSWTAPGDDGAQGRAAGYEVRVSREPITPTNWWLSAPIRNAPGPGIAGTTEYLFANDLWTGQRYYFALDTHDEAYNRSSLSNLASLTVGAGPSWATVFAPSPVGQGLDGSVEALVVHDGALIAGGMFFKGGRTPLHGVGRWDGTAWRPLGTGFDSWVFALAVFDGDLIAGGVFSTAGGVEARGIARWDGTQWAPMGAGVDAGVFALIVHGGELYAGGAFQRSGDRLLRGIARWDGHDWQPLGTGVNNQVFALAEFQGDLVAGGDFVDAGGAPGTSEIARWNGANWRSLGTGMDLDYVRALVVAGDDLYAGGQFIHADGVRVNSVARWDGGTWRALDDGVDRWVSALAIVDGELIAGGSFLTASGVSSAHLARWNGTGWAPFNGGSPNGEVHAILPTASGLVIGGWFTRTGSVASSYIGRWGP